MDWTDEGCGGASNELVVVYGDCSVTNPTRFASDGTGDPLRRVVRDGTVADFAELARLGKITQARVSQIVNLLNLGPDIQEDRLFLDRGDVTERTMRPIVAEADRGQQREMWREVKDGIAEVGRSDPIDPHAG